MVVGAQVLEDDRGRVHLDRRTHHRLKGQEQLGLVRIIRHHLDALRGRAGNACGMERDIHDGGLAWFQKVFSSQGGGASAGGGDPGDVQGGIAGIGELVVVRDLHVRHEVAEIVVGRIYRHMGMGWALGQA